MGFSWYIGCSVKVSVGRIIVAFTAHADWSCVRAQVIQPVRTNVMLTTLGRIRYADTYDKGATT